MPRAKGIIAALTTALIIAVAAGVVVNMQTTAELRRVRAERQELAAANAELRGSITRLEGRVREQEERPVAEERNVTLYFIVAEATEFVLVPEERTIPSDADAMEAALRELVAGPRVTAGAQAVFPPGTEVRGVRLDGTTAVADFSNEITRMNVGSSVEALAVASIVNTLTEFPQVQWVRILVDGQEVETLAGHVDISGTLERNERVIARRD